MSDKPSTPARSRAVADSARFPPEYWGEGETRRRAGRTIMAGLVLVLVFGLLVFSPLLLGRGSINRYIVAFALVGALLGASLLLHGSWDWLAARRRR